MMRPNRFLLLALACLITALAACAVSQPGASPAISPMQTGPDDFIAVMGEVLESDAEYALIDDMISLGKVKIILHENTQYPGKEKPDIKIGSLLSGDTAAGWMKSLPPQALLSRLADCLPAVRISGEVVEVGGNSILINDGQTGDPMALLISGDTFFAEGTAGRIVPGCTLEGYRAEEVMESWPPQARLLAVKSCK